MCIECTQAAAWTRCERSRQPIPTDTETDKPTNQPQARVALAEVIELLEAAEAKVRRALQ